MANVCSQSSFDDYIYIFPPDSIPWSLNNGDLLFFFSPNFEQAEML